MLLMDIFPQTQQFHVSQRFPTTSSAQVTQHHSDMSSHVADSMALTGHEAFRTPLSFDAGIPCTMLMNDFHSYAMYVV